MFRMGSVHAQDNGPGVSGTEPERTVGTGSYYMPVGLSIRPNRNRVSPLSKEIYPGDYSTPDRRQGSRGASPPHGNTWWPPGRIPGIVVQHLYGHHKHRSYIGTHQFPPSWCKLFNYYRLSNDNVHRVFAKVQYPWLLIGSEKCIFIITFTVTFSYLFI